MARYIGVRLAHSLVILAVVAVLVFVIAQLTPGDAIMAAMAGNVDMHDAQVVAQVRHQFGLDRPILVQFAVWLQHFVRGDWGTSIGTGENVLDMFLHRLPITLELFVGATLWAVAIGIPVGILGALKRNSALDMFLTAGTIVGVSIPSFWEAIVLIYVLGVVFPIVPPSGYVAFAEHPLLNLRAMLLPTFVLGTHSGGLLVQASSRCSARTTFGLPEPRVCPRGLWLSGTPLSQE
jgi:peptide/nickel transport system permease protein